MYVLISYIKSLKILLIALLDLFPNQILLTVQKLYPGLQTLIIKNLLTMKNTMLYKKTRRNIALYIIKYIFLMIANQILSLKFNIYQILNPKQILLSINHQLIFFNQIRKIIKFPMINQKFKILKIQKANPSFKLILLKVLFISFIDLYILYIFINLN